MQGRTSSDDHITPGWRSAPVQRALQISNLSAHVFHIWIDGQCQLESFECRDGVEQFQVTVPHADGCREMIRIPLERLLTVEHRLVVTIELNQGNRALVPRFRDSIRFINQSRGFADSLIKPQGIVQANDRLQLLLLQFAAIPTPEFPDTILSQQPNDAIVVMQRSTNDFVGFDATEKTER